MTTKGTMIKYLIEFYVLESFYFVIYCGEKPSVKSTLCGFILANVPGHVLAGSSCQQQQ